MWIWKSRACYCSYSGDCRERILKCASSWRLRTPTAQAVTTITGRWFHIFTTLWLKNNLRITSLDRFLLRFRECSPGSHGYFYMPVSCLPCTPSKVMNQDKVIGPFLHIQCHIQMARKRLLVGTTPAWMVKYKSLWCVLVFYLCRFEHITWKFHAAEIDGIAPCSPKWCHENDKTPMPNQTKQSVTLSQTITW